VPQVFGRLSRGRGRGRVTPGTETPGDLSPIQIHHSLQSRGWLEFAHPVIFLSPISKYVWHVAHPNTPNLEFPAADDTVLRQLMQARGYTYHRGPSRVGWFSPAGGPQQLKIIAGALGLPVPQPGRESVAA